MIRNRDRAAVIAPTAALARSAAAFLAGRLPHLLSPFSLPDYLATPRAPQRIVLCPSGRSVASDIDFLRRARERVLWGAPEEVVYSAIEGLLGSLPPTPPPGARRRRVAISGERCAETATALLLEGTVTSARARALLPQEPKVWIVQHPRRVRVEPCLMETLRREGVRWAALEPVLLLGLVASQRLARARPRWGRLLPRATPVWIRPG
jgi:hypothetical protein